MRIESVRTHVVGTAWRNITIVEVVADGLTGLGEVRMPHHTDALLGCLSETVPKHVIGSDPFDTEALVDAFTRLDYMRPGEIVMSALACIEIACWDLKGKALGVPVHQLLGGRVRDRVKAYANGWYQVARTPEQFADAARAVVARGYRALKFDPFGPGSLELDRRELDLSVDLIAAVRDAVGDDVDLLIEMHGRFTPRTAIRIAHRLAAYNPGWLEEPTPPHDPRSVARVAAAVDTPIAAGERIHTRDHFTALFDLGAIDIAQGDVTQSGGLWEAKKLAATAQLHNVLMAPHNVGGSVSTAANLHLAGSTVNFTMLEYFNDFADPYLKDCVTGLPEVVDGYFAVPDTPGLGVELHPDVIADHPRRDVNFNLFVEGWQRRQADQADLPATAP